MALLFVGGGDASPSVNGAANVHSSMTQFLPDGNLFLALLGLVSVVEAIELVLPISVRMPLPLLFSTSNSLLPPTLSPDVGDKFSASDPPPLHFPLAADQFVLLERLLGVTFLVGSAAARKPAFLSCSLRVCREVPGPDNGLVKTSEGNTPSRDLGRS